MSSSQTEDTTSFDKGHQRQEIEDLGYQHSAPFKKHCRDERNWIQKILKIPTGIPQSEMKENLGDEIEPKEKTSRIVGGRGRVGGKASNASPTQRILSLQR